MGSSHDFDGPVSHGPWEEGRHRQSVGWSLMFTTGLPEAGTVWSGRDKAGDRQNGQHSAILGFAHFMEVGDPNPQGRYGNEVRSDRTSVVKKIQSDGWKCSAGRVVHYPGQCRKDSRRRRVEVS